MEDIANAGSWEGLSPFLSAPILEAVKTMGFQQMTPVQAATVPLFMKNKDVVVEAATGSGKTLSFVIPALEMLLRRHRDNRPLLKNQIGALIISPTRELAKQIYEVTTLFIEGIRTAAATGEDDGNDDNDSDEEHSQGNMPLLNHMLFIGGNNVLEDMQKFQREGAQVVIGTPGRLDDLLKRGAIFNTKELEVLVLDEADRLLDMGFEQTLTSIIGRLPKQRRTGLFSATMSEGVGQLVRVGLRNPVKVKVKVETVGGGKAKEEQVTPSSLEISYVICTPEEKMVQLVRFLRKERDKKFIVYFATCACVDYYFKVLSTLPHLKQLTMYSLHGKIPPKRRTAVYEKFTQSPASTVLLCTDVAARGLDIPDVDYVIQYDPPTDPKSFAHRCGRTARAGRDGQAVVFLTEKETVYVEFLSVRKVPMREIPQMEDAKGQVKHDDVLQRIQKMNLSDREMFEKSTKAFVTWVRSYNEHQASFIFRFKDVDVASVARAFGLVRLPKMPELKGKQISFTGVKVNTNDIKYKDKIKEKQRVAKLEREKAQGKKEDAAKRKRKTETVAWSQHKEAKERRDERREKREKKRLAIAKAKSEGTFVPKMKEKPQAAKREGDSSSSDSGSEGDDWEEMKREIKKARKGGGKQVGFDDSD